MKDSKFDPFCGFFKLRFTPCKAGQPLRGMELQEKKSTKRLKEICLERTYRKKVSVNSRLQATKIISQKKAFYRQRILESSCARKETIDRYPCSIYEW